MNLNVDLKNIEIDEIKDKITSALQGLKEPKVAKKFAIYFVSIILFLIIYYVFIKPKVDAQQVKIDQMTEHENKTAEYKMNIENLRQQVSKIKPQYEKNTKLFHSKKEVEDLYQSISNYALVNGLTILNLKKNKPDAVGANSSQNNTNTNQNNNNAGSNPNAGTLYYKIPVDYQISGNFIGYLKFRQSLSKSNKHINFEKEKITIIQNNSSGSILAEGTISIVGLPNEFK